MIILNVLIDFVVQKTLLYIQLIINDKEQPQYIFIMPDKLYQLNPM